MSDNPQTGSILWADLTVPDAAAIRDFYAEVVGWAFSPVSQGEYDDYNMLPPGGATPAAGICYARGVNADVPPVWMIYIVVEDVAASMERCIAGGGRVVAAPHHGMQHAILQDPAGAIFAVFPRAE